MLEDQVTIQKKMEEHQMEYNELRRRRLESGRRSGSIYRMMRTKESANVKTGPELSIVVKGNIIHCSSSDQHLWCSADASFVS